MIKEKIDFYIDKEDHFIQLCFGSDKESAEEVFHFLRMNNTIRNLLVEQGHMNLEYTVSFVYFLNGAIPNRKLNDFEFKESAGWYVSVHPIVSGNKEFNKFVEDFVSIFSKTGLKFSTVDSDKLKEAILDVFRGSRTNV